MLCKGVCYGSSAAYHVFTWSPEAEILIQKFDHLCIAIHSAGTFVPLAILVLPMRLGMGLLCVSWALVGWNAHQLFVKCRPSVVNQILVPMTILLYMPALHTYFTGYELACAYATIGLQATGVYVFTREWPQLRPTFFGHHECFHVLVILAGVTVFLCNMR
jgi:hemolysin III